METKPRGLRVEGRSKETTLIQNFRTSWEIKSSATLQPQVLEGLGFRV